MKMLHPEVINALIKVMDFPELAICPLEISTSAALQEVYLPSLCKVNPVTKCLVELVHALVEREVILEEKDVVSVEITDKFVESAPYVPILFGANPIESKLARKRFILRSDFLKMYESRVEKAK